MRCKGSVGMLWRIVTVAVAVLCVCCIVNAFQSDADALAIAFCAVPTAIAGILTWTLLDNYVELGDDVLRVCVGPFRLRVPYGDITRVSEYRPEGTVIALALGRNRVIIGRRGRASVVVSVVDAGDFMDELRRQSGCM